MTYILVVFLSIYSKPSSLVGIEFNSLEACQAAATEIRKQRNSDTSIGILFCSAKGEKK
jgi:hypothetical protein